MWLVENNSQSLRAYFTEFLRKANFELIQITALKLSLATVTFKAMKAKIL